MAVIVGINDLVEELVDILSFRRIYPSQPFKPIMTTNSRLKSFKELLVALAPLGMPLLAIQMLQERV
ncbi:hypothetical protein PMIT1320_00581 [Prochlorococcus marinus str. MIT 1320]|nr:hypothetical protein PMIT1320_00581 [Prochlorococcus marinus str. MIT 1320]